MRLMSTWCALTARGMGKRLRRALVGAALGLAGFSHSPGAKAWIFPEHAEITRFDLDHQLPAELRQELERMLDEAVGQTDCQVAYTNALKQNRGFDDEGFKQCRRSWVPLCHELTTPFARLWSREAEHCIPFSALPALAGDHAVTTASLRTSFFEGDYSRVEAIHRFGGGTTRKVLPLAFITFDVSHRFADFLDEAPIEVSRLYRNSAADGERGTGASDGERHRFFRSLDVRLQALDKNYSDRAAGCRAHFQDASVPLETLLRRAAEAGDTDNALAQTFAHHMRSLELAYAAGLAGDADGSRVFASEAFLEHAFALHFMEDAFASGHFGTEPAVTALERLRRHDYLNRVGLPAMRVMSVRGCNSAAESSSPEKTSEGDQRCWTAYGDGYLDATNAARASRGAAHLSAQLALAFRRGTERALEKKPASATRAPGGGRGGKRRAGQREYRAPRQLGDRRARDCVHTPIETGTPERHTQKLNPKAETDSTTSTNPFIVRDGQSVLHLYRRHLNKGAMLQIKVDAEEFRPALSVYAASGGTVASSEDEPSKHAELTFRADESGDYAISLSSQRATQGGDYVLTIGEVVAGPVADASCKQLFALADLLDPVPPWTQAIANSTDLPVQSVEDRAEQARRTLNGVDDALDQLNAQRENRGRFLRPAQAGDKSSEQRGALTTDIVGHPLEPCEPSTERKEAFCDGRATYRFGDIDASLIRPVLADWPGPTATIQAVRGEDSFGVGLAGQAIFGAGVSLATIREAPWAVSPLMFGLGLSARFDSLLPGSRVNREAFGVNVAAFPLALSGVDDTRYVLAGFGEVRAPVWALTGALTSGTSWDLFSAMDIGPTGARAYFTLPNRADSQGRGSLELLGWDIEVLNIRISPPATSARTATIGLGMDTELRVRVGRADLSRLDDAFPGTWATMVGLEVAGGYSVFLWQKR